MKAYEQFVFQGIRGEFTDEMLVGGLILGSRPIVHKIE